MWLTLQFRQTVGGSGTANDCVRDDRKRRAVAWFGVLGLVSLLCVESLRSREMVYFTGSLFLPGASQPWPSKALVAQVRNSWAL